MTQFWKMTLAALLGSWALLLFGGCEVEMDEGPIEDATEEVAD